LFRLRPFERHRHSAGFTLIEVLVALVVIAVMLTAIGSLMAANVRGRQSIEQHFGLVETAHAVETALPDRNALGPGTLSGDVAGYTWRIDVSPFVDNSVDPRLASPWVPQRVLITVQAPTGQVLRINTVRLFQRPKG
jgi:general secretion pathway protein I